MKHNPLNLFGGTKGIPEGHETPFAMCDPGGPFFYVRMRMLGGEWVPVHGPWRKS